MRDKDARLAELCKIIPAFQRRSFDDLMAIAGLYLRQRQIVSTTAKPSVIITLEKK